MGQQLLPPAPLHHQVAKANKQSWRRGAEVSSLRQFAVNYSAVSPLDARADSRPALLPFVSPASSSSASLSSPRLDVHLHGAHHRMNTYIYMQRKLTSAAAEQLVARTRFLPLLLLVQAAGSSSSSSFRQLARVVVRMQRHTGRDMWDVEECQSPRMGSVILGVDGGASNTVCVCIPAAMPFNDPLPVLSRTVAGCSNHNSVGEDRARETLERVMSQALLKARRRRSNVCAVCLAVAGVNHPLDQERMLDWLREIFPSHVKLFVENDAVAALASGTMGKLHGCVLIAGTGTIAYGFTRDGREARAAGAGPVLGDWGSGYGISAQAMTAVVRAYDGRGPETVLTNNILDFLGLASPDELIGWTYEDQSWARIADLLPVVVESAASGDEVANKILHNSVGELASSVKAVVQRLELGGEDGRHPFPLVMVGKVLEANKKWDIGKEVIDCVTKNYPGAYPIHPKVEPAVGAALLAWNAIASELDGDIRNVQ